MSYAAPHDSSRRLTGLAFVVALHVVLVYALVNGLARKIVEVVQAPLETRIIEEIKPPADKPPLPPLKLAPPPPPFIPMAEVRIDNPPPATNTITAVAAANPPPPVPAPGPVVVAPPIKTVPVVDARNCSKPEYPFASLRAQEEGPVVLQFLIGIDGRALDSKVERSSGYRRLDEAARRALALCKFKPGTEDGKAVQSWARIEYQWKIED